MKYKQQKKVYKFHPAIYQIKTENMHFAISVMTMMIRDDCCFMTAEYEYWILIFGLEWVNWMDAPNR